MSNAEIYTVVESCYGDPLLKRTDLGPFQKYPERTSWVDFEVREYPDGLKLRYERDCGRWSSVTQCGDWILASERAANIAQRELAELRKRVALFVETTENPGQAPFPPIKGAESPGVHPSTWYDYLKREARKAERVTSCMYPDSTHERRCENVDFTTGQPYGPRGWRAQGACPYCSTKHEIAAAEKAAR